MAEPKASVAHLSKWQTMRRKDASSLAHAVTYQMQPTGVSRQQDFIESFREEAQGIFRSIVDNVQRLQSDVGITRITFLPNKELRAPIEVVVERDGEAFLARTLELPLYGHGDDVIEAIGALKSEIETLYDDLMEDDNFSTEWLRIKEYLKARISDR